MGPDSGPGVTPTRLGSVTRQNAAAVLIETHGNTSIFVWNSKEDYTQRDRFTSRPLKTCTCFACTGPGITPQTQECRVFTSCSVLGGKSSRWHLPRSLWMRRMGLCFRPGLNAVGWHDLPNLALKTGDGMVSLPRVTWSKHSYNIPFHDCRASSVIISLRSASKTHQATSLHPREGQTRGWPGQNPQSRVWNHCIRLQTPRQAA